MVKQICTIYDTKAQFFGAVMTFLSLAAAGRAFQDALENEQSEMAKHPEDYILYKVGTFDEQNGVVEASPPIEVMRGLEANSEQPEVKLAEA